MRNKKQIFNIVVLLLFVIIGYILNGDDIGDSSTLLLTSAPQPSPVISAFTDLKEYEYLVTKVIDGDTIEVNHNQKVRMIGIDTPETVDPRRPDQCFGKEASQKTKELLEGRIIRLEKDISETDSFNRLLRYVYINDTFINETLVRDGYAKVASFPPDIKFQELFRQAETEARENQRGLWSSQCNNQ